MARIYGKIESLKSLKSELNSKGISRFKSVREINSFLANHNQEKVTILKETSEKLEKKYFRTCASLKERIILKTEIVDFETKRINYHISDVQTKINLLNNNDTNSVFIKLLTLGKLFFLKQKYKRYVKNKPKLIDSAIKEISKKIKNDELFIDDFINDKQKLIEQTAQARLKELEYTRRIVKNCRNLISGAIGENLVVKEIKKLPDDYVLINDFNLSFSRPIFYKKHNQIISSIQIDHLLISKAGIFIIETKNWSKSSVNSFNLRSPIEQIERCNYALYLYISKNITLNDHHWGEQQIPIRNLIVMINHKPKAKFKHVRIKLLSEMNNYIKYFEPVLSDNQMNKIITELI